MLVALDQHRLARGDQGPGRVMVRQAGRPDPLQALPELRQRRLEGKATTHAFGNPPSRQNVTARGGPSLGPMQAH